MTDRRELAVREAEAFTERTIEEIRRVLAWHGVAVVDYAIEMHARTEAAEALLAEIAACSRSDPMRKSPTGHGRRTTVNVHNELMTRVDNLVAAMKARTP